MLPRVPEAENRADFWENCLKNPRQGDVLRRSVLLRFIPRGGFPRAAESVIFFSDQMLVRSSGLSLSPASLSLLDAKDDRDSLLPRPSVPVTRGAEVFA